jgi:integrase
MEQKQISPNRVPKVRQFTENNARQGFVDYEEFSALVKHLPSPVDDVCWFAYLSGWRKGEVLSLTWADVDQTLGVVTLRPEFSKNKEKRELPLVDQDLQAVIARRWQARLVMTKDGPKVCDSLFHRDGQPVKDVRRKWRKACKAIGRPGLLLHDLRRSAVRNLVNAGTPERVAMRITGHKTREVFDRYMIVDDRDVRAALVRTEAVRAQASLQHKAGIFQHSGPTNTELTERNLGGLK